MSKKKKEKVGVRGFYRVAIEEPFGAGNGKLVGDSGWNENQIVNLGFQDFLCANLAGTTGSKRVLGINIGSGTVPGAAATTLDGEISTAKRMGGTDMTVAISSDSKQVEFKATFYSSRTFVASSSSLRNIGLFDCTTATGNLFAGSTYAISTCDTNQNVNVTYKISFS